MSEDEGAPAPRVSVVMPVYNAGAYLDPAVQSVLAEHPTHPLELLLVDDGSTDGSAARVQALAAAHPEVVRAFSHPGGENRGAGASRNVALAAARGEAVCFLDADDYWLPGRLDGALAMLDADPALDGAWDYTRVVFESQDQRARYEAMGEVAETVGRKEDLAPGAFWQAYLDGRVSWDTRGILVRRKSLARVGGFEESLRKRQDVQMWFRMAARLRLRPTPGAAPVAVYRRHPGNRFDPSLRTTQRAAHGAAMEEFWDLLHAWMREHLDEGPAWDAFLRAELAQLGRHRRFAKAWRRARECGRPLWFLRALRQLVPGPRTLASWLRGRPAPKETT